MSRNTLIAIGVAAVIVGGGAAMILLRGPSGDAASPSADRRGDRGSAPSAPAAETEQNSVDVEPCDLVSTKDVAAAVTAHVGSHVKVQGTSPAPGLCGFNVVGPKGAPEIWAGTGISGFTIDVTLSSPPVDLDKAPKPTPVKVVPGADATWTVCPDDKCGFLAIGALILETEPATVAITFEPLGPPNVLRSVAVDVAEVAHKRLSSL